MAPNEDNPGIVFLVGAGPGHPDLITLRGVDCLRRADVVLYDYLVNTEVLRHTGPNCERICLGQHGQSRIWQQSEINREIVCLARAGKTVVRLKGGDPAVFARGAEEAETLANEKIPFEIVPGITAALAAGSYAGIPITHRDLASAVALITGQEHPAKDGSALDYDALAKFPGTLVFYMGVTTAEHWKSRLIDAGKSPETSCAIVRRCSLPDQRVVHCRLGDVARTIENAAIRPPAIVIVGPVVELAATLSWFDKRPLFGQRVLITRPAHQADGLASMLRELGAETLKQPAIEIADPDDWQPIDTAIDRLGEFDWIVFSSANGVNYFLNRLLQRGHDLRALGTNRLAAIGPGTSDALAEYRLSADLQPEQFRAESLADALTGEAQRGARFLLIRASRGRDVLNERLSDDGGSVEQIVVYQSTDVAALDPSIRSAAEANGIDWITVTSSAIAKSVVRLFGQRLNSFRLASISPITSQTLRESGFEPAAEATTFTMPGVVDAIRRATAIEP